MDVLDRDGDKIGEAREALGSYFKVDAGLLGMKEFYVPFDAIMETRDNAIYVNCDKDDLDRMGWDHRPTERETTSRTGETQDTLQLREEELHARKTSMETGRVQLGKEIVEEERTLEVPVAREEVYVERRPVERRPADAPIDDSQSEDIRVPVREERVELEKQPVVYEEVGIGTRVTQDTEQVSGTVRREELRTDSEGDVEVHKDNR